MVALKMLYTNHVEEARQKSHKVACARDADGGEDYTRASRQKVWWQLKKPVMMMELWMFQQDVTWSALEQGYSDSWVCRPLEKHVTPGYTHCVCGIEDVSQEVTRKRFERKHKGSLMCP